MNNTGNMTIQSSSLYEIFNAIGEKLCHLTDFCVDTNVNRARS